jgi:hypothetical protein
MRRCIPAPPAADAAGVSLGPIGQLGGLEPSEEACLDHLAARPRVSLLNRHGIRPVFGAIAISRRDREIRPLDCREVVFEMLIVETIAKIRLATIVVDVP